MLLIIAALILCAVVGALIAFRSLIASGITTGVDNIFGDQHLKTAVALIEPHKIRHGHYPDSLRDLEFTGQWDQMAVHSVAYYPSGDRKSYYVEVERGWIGKPTSPCLRNFGQELVTPQH